MSFPGFGITAFILYLTGVQARGGSICALPGSTVDLHCSHKHHHPNRKWYFKETDDLKQLFWNELVIDGKYKTSKRMFSLRIKHFSESEAKSYCCTNTDVTTFCNQGNSKVQLADLQVKVLSEKEGDKVTLMCKSSCRLSKKPEAYIWYRNGTFLSEHWSPWYQRLVSSKQAVRYSCTIKGYEHLRAPEVSVDAVTPTCFSVTYAEGKMCSGEQRSVGEPCSITYPRDLRVVLDPAEATEGQTVMLRCSTSCPLGNSTAYTWYLDQKVLSWPQSTSKELVLDPVSSQHAGNYSCAVKTHKHIKSSEKTLVVRTSKWLVPVATAGSSAALIVTISLGVYFWIRRKKKSGPPPSRHDTNNTELVNTDPVYENFAPQLREQRHLPRSTVHFSNAATELLYSNAQCAQPAEQEQVTYAVVNFGHKPPT